MNKYLRFIWREDMNCYHVYRDDENGIRKAGSVTAQAAHLKADYWTRRGWTIVWSV